MAMRVPGDPEPAGDARAGGPSLAERRAIFVKMAAGDGVGTVLLLAALIAGFQLHQVVLAIGLGAVGAGWMAVVWTVFFRRLAAWRRENGLPV